MKSTRIFIGLVLFFAVLNLFSCRGAEKVAASTTPSPLADPNQPQAGDDTMGFRVWADSTPLTTFISHKGTGIVSDDFGAKCEINSTDSVKDIMCMVEAEELDLYFHGVNMHYNVPSTMCAYVRHYMPFYYNVPAGVGAVTAVDNLNGTVVHGGVAAGSTDESCNYDYTESKGPNCCTGKYTLTTWSTSDSGDTSVTAVKDWGGDPTSCLYGPATKIMPKVSGVPVPVIDYVESQGVSATLKIEAPINLELSTNIFASNYFVAADHVATSNKPLAYNALAAYPAINPYPYYLFECLDRSKELTARIRVSIREWNLESEFQIGATGDPDSSGTESGFDNPNVNDYYDLKDVPLNVGDFPSGYPAELGL